MYKAIFLCCFLPLIACKKKNPDPPTQANLVFKFRFDPNQERLDGFGNQTTLPAGNAGQSPIFNTIAAHYFEFSPNAFTPLGAGSILYHAPEVSHNNETAIDFEQSIFKGENEVYLTVPIKDIPANTYEYLRVSLSYQNYDIFFRFNGNDFRGTVASFIR